MEENGLLQVIFGFYKGLVLNYNSVDNIFCGVVDLVDFDFQIEKVVMIIGKVGSMFVYYVWILYGLVLNVFDWVRLMLFYECCVVDVWLFMGGFVYIQCLLQ